MKQFIFSTFAIIAITFSACVKTEFDTPPPTPPCDWEANTTIQALKDSFLLQTTDTVRFSEDLIFRAVVTADDASGNFFRNIILQDETGGITLRFGVTDLYNSYPVGREVFVNVNGLNITDYNGVLQLGEIQEAVLQDHICRGVKGLPVEPEVVTIADLNDSHINTLVRIENVQFVSSSAGVPFADAVSNPPQSVNHLVEECAGDRTLIVRTSGYSDFAADLTPAGSGYIVGVYGVFGTDQQLFVRDPGDVQFNDDRCESPLDEDFQGGTPEQAVAIQDWGNFAIKGSRLWQIEEFQGNRFAEATAFQDSESEMEAWLVTPPIDLETPKTMRFETAMAYYAHDGFSILIATDYEGDVTTATWEPLPCIVADGGSDWFDWVASGEIDLSVFNGGTAHVAFVYEGSGPGGETTNYRVDNVEVFEQ
jgi:hypothetical protein